MGCFGFGIIVYDIVLAVDYSSVLFWWYRLFGIVCGFVGCLLVSLA